MSEHAAHSEHPSASAESEQLFTADEIRQFDRDDAEAGQAIGKMLSIMFLYTVIVMGISAAVTYYWVTNPGLS